MTHDLRVLAVSSPGGHWLQLLQLAPSFSSASTLFVTCGEDHAQDVQPAAFASIPDGSRSQPLKLLALGFQLARLIRQHRPDVVLSTGAAPGLMAMLVARIFGIRAVWVDSIANASQLSLSGRLARWLTSSIYTQWPHLARPAGPAYLGAVL